MSDFQRDRFRDVLIAAAREAFALLEARAAGERFYAFALYTAGEAEYVVPTANTEEGLARRAREYAGRDGGDLALHLASLRWSPADWAYHEDAQASALFDGVNTLLAEPDPYSLPEAVGARRREDAFEACLQALAALDGEGRFGRGPAREGVAVALLMGDQSDEARVAWVVRLNPADVAGRFAAELGRGNDAFEALHPADGTRTP